MTDVKDTTKSPNFSVEFNFDDIQRLHWLHDKRRVTYIELYKQYLMYTRERKIELQKKRETMWMSNIKSPVTFMICSALYGMYLDNQIAFEVYKVVRRVKKKEDESVADAMAPGDVNEEIDAQTMEEIKDDDLSRDILTLLDHFSGYDDGPEDNGFYESFDRVALDAIILGTGFGQIVHNDYKDVITYTHWNKDEDGEVVSRGMVEYTERYSQPGIAYISPFNIMYDQAAQGWLQSCRYIIKRRIMSPRTFNKAYAPYGIELKKKEVEESGRYVQIKDWEMVIRWMIFGNIGDSGLYNKLPTLDGTNDGTWSGDYTDFLSDNSFSIGQERKQAKEGWLTDTTLMEVFEVHTDEGIQVFADGVDHKPHARLSPWKKKPFFSIKFKSGLNGIEGIGAAYIAHPYQTSADVFMRLRVDTDRIKASQPTYVPSDDPAFDGMDYMEVYPGKMIKVRDLNAIPRPAMTIDQGTVANQEVMMLEKTIMDSLGLQGYSLGTQQKVERAARGIKELVEATDRSLKEFTISISKAMSFVSKYMLILAHEYMDEQRIINITGSNKFKLMSMEQLIKNYSFGFDLRANKTMQDEASLELMRRFVQDASQMTRQDGSPIFDSEAGFAYMLNKSNLPEDLLLTHEESLERMKKSMETKSRLQKIEQELAQQNGVVNPWQSMVDQWGNQWADGSAIGLPPMGSGVQWGSLGPGTEQTFNPEGNNVPL